MYEKIPQEMRSYRQWIVWKYEETGGGKPTKVPYSPHGQGMASVTNSSTWGTYDEAVAAASWYNGIGFVLTEQDPYGFIDLDDTKGDQTAIARQLKIHSEFNSYSEVSPSGQGLHIIVKGKIPNGRRRSFIEVYSSLRYMTMTGDVYGTNTVIEERHNLLNTLYYEMGGKAANSIHDGNAPQTQVDEEVVQRASSAANGEKFHALHVGNWQQFYASQSEADLAYMDILAFYTQNSEQLRRMFRMSALGQRDKAQREDYVNTMLNKSFDKLSPPVDVSGFANALNDVIALMAKEKAALAVQPTAPDIREVSSIPLPPGLLGEIAQYVYQSSPRPVPEISIVAAIGLMAGITGRAYNVSGTGLNMYTLLLAPTGTGKEAIQGGISSLMNYVRLKTPAAGEFIGPSEIRSDVALTKFMANSRPSIVSLVGEFGLALRNMSSQNANGSQVGIKRVLLDLYNKSGKGAQLGEAVYSDKEKNSSILYSPAFSMIGESTPESFYDSVDETMIADGLLPRFLTIEYHGHRPALSEFHTQVTPTMQLVDQLGLLTAECLKLVKANEVVQVQLDADAKRMADELEIYATAQINTAGSKEVVRHLWNRVHLKTLKLASLVAVGCHFYRPVVNAAIFEWARTLVFNDTQNVLRRFESGEIGKSSEESKQITEVIKVIRNYVLADYSALMRNGVLEAMHKDRVVPSSFIQQKLIATAAFRNDRLGATNAIKRTFQSLIENGDIRELSKNDTVLKYGTGGRCFAITNTSLIRS